MTNTYTFSQPIAIALTPLVTITSSLFLSIFAIYKSFIWCILKVTVSKDFRGISTGIDMMMDLFTTKYPLTVNVMAMIETEDDFDKLYKSNIKKIESIINSEIGHTNLFCSKKSYMGYQYLEHTRSIKPDEIFKTFDCKVTSKNLPENLEKCFKLPLPKNNTFIWDFYLFTTPLIVDGKKVWIVTYRFHHAVADGFTVYNVLTTLMCQKSDLKEDFANNVIKKFQNKSSGDATKLRIDKLPPILNTEKNILSRSKYCEEASIGIFMEKDEGYIRKIKEIRAQLGIPFTSILLTAYSAALTNYLKDKDITDANNYLSILIPVQRQATRMYKYLTEDSLKDLSNDFILVILKFPCILEEGVMTKGELMQKRLYMVHEEITKLTKSYEVQIAAFQLLTYLNVVPICILKRIWGGIRLSCGATIFPGGPKLTFHSGGNVKNILFFLPKSATVGVFLCIFTYDNKINASLISDQIKFNNREELQNILSDMFGYVDVIYNEIIKEK